MECTIKFWHGEAFYEHDGRNYVCSIADLLNISSEVEEAPSSGKDDKNDENEEEDDCSDYDPNFVVEARASDDNIINTIMNPRHGQDGFIGGGGKRNRANKNSDDDDDEKDKYVIHSMEGMELVAKEGDAGVISTAMRFEFSPEEWVNGLNEKKLKNLDELLTKYKGRDAQDTTVRAIAMLLNEMTEIEDQKSRLALSSRVIQWKVKKVMVELDKGQLKKWVSNAIDVARELAIKHAVENAQAQAQEARGGLLSRFLG